MVFDKEPFPEPRSKKIRGEGDELGFKFEGRVVLGIMP
jgi:hypothetical protein